MVSMSEPGEYRLIDCRRTWYSVCNGQKSLISHRFAGSGLFAAMGFGAGETAGLYFGLVYKSFIDEKQK